MTTILDNLQLLNSSQRKAEKVYKELVAGKARLEYRWPPPETSSLLTPSPPLTMSQIKKLSHANLFSLNRLLGLFCHRVAMSVCESVPLQNTHFWVSGRPLVKECIPNIGL